MINKVNKSWVINRQLSIILIVCLFIFSKSTAQYQLKINFVDKDTLFNPQSLKLTTSFSNNLACVNYINQLPGLLHSKGYPVASVDSVAYYAGFAIIQLYVGKQFQKIKLHIDGGDKKLFSVVGNSERSLDVLQIQKLQQGILNYYENNGYPFASTYLDSISFNDVAMTATLKIDKGVLYHIDSIRVYGKAKISNVFLQQYLGIKNSSIYSREKLQNVGKRLLNLPYLQEQQPSDITLLGTGSILNLYLQPKPSSQINFLVGFLPADNQTGKLRFTGDVNLNLKNVLAHGETLLLNWQQLQAKSPRLNIGFQQPYIFRSPFGIDFSFNLFKKDSTFIQLNTQLGLQYLLSANQSGKIFFQQQSSVLLSSGVDTDQVKATKQLPLNIDVSATNVGLDYEWNNTNYLYNPIKGNELKLTASVGVKKITKNNDVLSLKDPLFDYGSLYDSLKLKTYQFRVKISAAHFFPLGKLSTLKAVLNTGLYNSENTFRNELFQIGGYKILRGFDEESIYATQYGVATAEYRYLLGLNSYLFAFVDAGWVKNHYQSINVNNNFISSGAGLAFETKLGLLNISFAIGKRNDIKQDFRQAAKIHFGYINYF
ncbi:BamA/TamA family outer membrane protein [Ferruginibacter lapsinanis]|uniref:ShlB/FhaC/HecB family hemolysin secretion/activation protein n=1 Tax=Ferruginibacter lapsinanis TaxID=563172 RepID=UPI001E4DE58B|nr:BamA/TamA family outer membrane protein [Ferruginibacter lapsinanis]UEG51152.1 BamA/TamA family outer membrane protein [Ferruginibacter lapsinanis]